MTYGIRYPNGTILPATHQRQAGFVAASAEGRSVVLVLDVTTYEDDQAELPALRRLGPDVGEPDDAQSVAYIDPDLERQVMEVIARYPQSRLEPDGKVHGLAAASAILAVERWLLTRQSVPATTP